MAIQIQSSDLSINTLQLSECSWDLTLPPEQTENKLLYGGVVTWLQDYDFHVSAAGYYINNVFYESPEAYITLSPADALLNRFDVIYVDADQIVKVREGDPSLTPSQPGLDLGLELGLGVVFVEAASTEPVELVQECIYQENGEWVSLVSAGTIDPASSNTPCIGTLSVEATSAANGDYLLMNRALSFAPTATFNVITFRLKPKGDWSTNPAQHKLILRFRLAGVQVGSTVEIAHGSPLGFDVTDTGTCQIISISTIQFGIPESAIVDQLQIEVFSTSGTFGWFIDGLCLQGGIFGADEGDFIWNQYFGAQTPGRYWIQGNGRADGWFTSPQRIGDTDNFYMGSEKFGWASSIVASTTGTAIGYLAKAEGQEGATAVGNQAYANVGVAIGFFAQSVRGVAVGGNQLGPGGTAVGWGSVNTSLSGTSLGGGANTSGIGAIATGYYSSATGYGGIAIGTDAQSLSNYSAAFGVGARTTGEYQLVLGGDTEFQDVGYRSLYFGAGVTSPFTADRFWTITGAEGTDIPENTWRFGGAAGTGNALSGPIEWQTSDPTVSGSTLQSWSTKMALNSNTKGLYLDNTRFQMDEGSDVIAATNLTLGTGNAFTVTGSATINAITNTNWQDGAVVYLLFTGAPTIKNETAGGAGTAQIKLAGDVDFAATPDTLLSLQYKDNYWREIGRTQSSAIGAYTFLNGLHEELGGLVKWGGTLIEDTTIVGNTFSTIFVGGNGFLVGTIDEIQLSTQGDIILTSDSDANTSQITMDTSGNITLAADTDVVLDGAVRTIVDGRFETDEGIDIVAANNLTLGLDGNAFTITGNTQINAITTTSWQEGSSITLHLTGTPTLKHNTVGGAGTAPLRLAGAVDFSITGYTVLELQYKDGYWNEVGRTIATGGGSGLVSADNALNLSTSTNVQWGGPLVIPVTTITFGNNEEVVWTRDANNYMSWYGDVAHWSWFGQFQQDYGKMDFYADGFNYIMNTYNSLVLTGTIDFDYTGTLTKTGASTIVTDLGLINLYSDAGGSDYSNFVVDNTALQNKYTLEAQSTTMYSSIKHQEIGAASSLELNSTRRIELDADIASLVVGRFSMDEGATQASANNLTLGYGGNSFLISGNTQINAITGTDWEEGSFILLKFSGTPTLKHNTAGGAGTFPMKLAGATDYTASADDAILFEFGGNFWNEVTRKLSATAPFTGISADNGLRENVANNVQWGGPVATPATILFDTHINADVYDINITGAKSGTNGIFQVIATSSGSAAIYGVCNLGGFAKGVRGFSSTGFGVWGETTGSGGVMAISTTGIGLNAQSTGGGVPIEINSGTSGVLAATQNVMRIRRTDSGGSAAAGFGSNIIWRGSSATVGDRDMAQMDVLWKVATDASRTSEIKFSASNAAVVQDVLTLGGEGYLKLRPITAAAASAITPAEGMIVIVSDTDGTFTSVGFWGYSGGAWAKF